MWPNLNQAKFIVTKLNKSDLILKLECVQQIIGRSKFEVVSSVGDPMLLNSFYVGIIK
jgi:hypothetical protein